MAEGSASFAPESDVLSALKSLQEQFQEQQRVQASILEQLSVVEQSSISTSSHTPVASGLLSSTSPEEDSREYN